MIYSSSDEDSSSDIDSEEWLEKAKLRIEPKIKSKLLKHKVKSSNMVEEISCKNNS